MHALSALFVDSMLDDNSNTKKEMNDSDLSPRQVMMNFLDTWPACAQANLPYVETKLDFLININDYTAYHTEFINRFYLKWVTCYIIVLLHLFEHESNNITNGKYKAGSSTTSESSSNKKNKKKKNKDKDSIPKQDDAMLSGDSDIK